MFTKYRNATMGFLYVYLLKPIFFAFDPEDVHDFMLGVGKFLGDYSLLKWKTKFWFGFEDKSLEQNILGIHFKNPIGLSAGFDKNAELLDILPSVGFGFSEVGSVTGFPCEGNPRPRLWRLPKSKGLVVYYGLKNNGCEEISCRLFAKKFKIPFGTNVAMTNSSINIHTQTAISDYAKAFQAFVEIGDYFTVNLSCPNTKKDMPFLDPENLNNLLNRIDIIQTKKPVFVKLSPDLEHSQVDAILEVLKKHRVHGIICSNLTKKSGNPKIFEPLPPVGGVSGKPTQELSDNLISYIYKKEGNKFIIIGCGGVFSAKDAYAKIRKGATLIELITGMIFEGPQLISEINHGLVELLHNDGFSNISQAIGADYK